MAHVAPARGKRARSPSPSPGYVDTLASPLEVLLKRRRRTDAIASAGGVSSNGTNGNANGSTGSSARFAPPPPPVWDGQPYHNAQYHYDETSSQPAASSPLRHDEDDLRRAVDRRRTRQWERLQDPRAGTSASASTSAAPSASSSAYLPPIPYGPEATPERPTHSHHTHHRGHYNPHAPSSSPVCPPGPSAMPFQDEGEYDDWTADERMREWGDEYAAQNSLLYSLHRTRIEALHSSGHDEHMTTPAAQRTARPAHSSVPSSAPSVSPHPHPHPHPHQHHQHAYRHHRTPLATPGFVSSEYASSPVFSPVFPPAGPAPSPTSYNVPRHEAEAVRTGYEEANRLLAALNVARMRRHGDASPRPADRGDDMMFD